MLREGSSPNHRSCSHLAVIGVVRVEGAHNQMCESSSGVRGCYSSELVCDDHSVVNNDSIPVVFVRRLPG